MYSMNDPATIHSNCGTEDYTYPAKSHGQEAVCLAQAMVFSGYTTTPSWVIDRCNAHGWWTTVADADGPGLIDWAHISDLLTQVHDGGTQYALIQGVWGRFSHTLLKHGDLYFDPYSGTNVVPDGFHPTGRIRTFHITGA